MIALRRLWIAVAAGALAVFPLSATGCSSTPTSMPPNIQPGDMPSGADWTGVYYSQLYGNLHIVQEGNAVSGRWIRPAQDRWGEVHGSATGDLLRFTWVEHTIGAIGPTANRNGKGYFKYKRPPGENVDDTIEGEIGRDQSEAGEPWDAIKQRNVKPNPNSIGGTSATDIGGGDWDSDNKEKGKPEAPVSPPPP